MHGNVRFKPAGRPKLLIIAALLLAWLAVVAPERGLGQEGQESVGFKPWQDWVPLHSTGPVRGAFLREPAERPSFSTVSAAAFADGPTPLAADPASEPQRGASAAPRSDASQGAAAESAAGKEGATAPPRVEAYRERPITTVTTSIRPTAGTLPEDFATEALQPTAGAITDYRLSSRCKNYFWEAPGLCHGPLYFEDVNLERYGVCPKGTCWLQPALSGVKFLGTVPVLPLLISAHPPCERIYELGYDRPGDCVPFRCQYPELRLIPASVEAGAIAGAVLLIP